MTGAVHESRSSAHELDTQDSTPGPVTRSAAHAAPAQLRLSRVQTALGNRGFGNYVRTLARQPVQQSPPRPPAQSVTVYLVGPPPPIHAVERATEKNRRLAELIDEIDKLSNADVIERRRTEVYEAQAKSGADLRDRELALEAAEYVAKYRGLTPLAPYYTVDTPGIHRLDIRVGLEHGIRQHHSFKEAFAEIADVPSNDDAKAFFKSFETSFRLEFKRQAYATAFAMLRASQTEIEKVLQSYGIPVQAARTAGNRISHNGVLSDEVKYVLNEMKLSAGVDTKAHTHARFDLAETVAALKRQKELALKLDHDAYALAGNVGVTDEVMSLKRQAVAEKAKFQQMWIEAEQSHAVLTAYRHGGDIWQVDLGDLDTAPVDDEMAAVLMHVLPKLGDMFEAHDKLRDGSMSPLSIPSLVALTKTNMFIPKDSLRDGIANDMAEEDGTESKWIILGSILLALVTFFPSGGASLGIVAGMASVGLATYSAVHEWEKYTNQKMLSDTDLDIAHSLATEEPSLTPFIVSLVSLGLEPIALAGAFSKLKRLKGLSGAGEDTKALVNELNQLGKQHGKPNLGDEALEDIEAAQQESKAGKAAKGASTVPKIKDTAFGLLDKAEARAKSIEGLTAIRGSLPERWDMVKAALRETDGSTNRRLLGMVDQHMAALRDTDAWGDVLADAWEIAAKMRKPDLRDALLKLAKQRGIKSVKVPGILDLSVFVDRYVTPGLGIIDPGLAIDGQKLHGELTHLIQDLVIDKKLGAGASARFRKLLGEAEGRIYRYLPGGNTPSKFGAFTGPNTTFIDAETSMKTGDYVWRFTYDLLYLSTQKRRMPQPEAIGPVLQKLFGLK